MPTGIYPRPDVATRFWAKVKVAGPDECWLWTAAHWKGYGLMGVGGIGTRVQATWVSWFLHTGRWPVAFMCHHCDNPPCVNPAHLFEGTAKDNAQDAIRKGRFHHPQCAAKGERCARSKLGRDSVLEIRKIGRSDTYAAVAAHFSVSPSCVADILKRRTWKHL